MLNPGDVKKVILIVIGQVAFHLLRIHAAEGLRHIDSRCAQLGEDVGFHGPGCESRNKYDRQHHHDDRDRPPQSKLGQRQKRCQIAFGSRHTQQCPPHAKAGQRIVNLRLGQDPLRFGYFGNVAQPGFIARCRLLFGGARSF